MIPGVCSSTVQRSRVLGRSSRSGRSRVSRTPLPRRSRRRRETAATLSVIPARASCSLTSTTDPASTTTSASGESSKPGCAAVMLQAPGSSPRNPNRPDGPAVCSRRTPRPGSTRDTRAPGSTPPVASRTTPSTPPVGWAAPGAGSAPTNALRTAAASRRCRAGGVAEREGFEPSARYPAQLLSRPALFSHSSTSPAPASDEGFAAGQGMVHRGSWIGAATAHGAKSCYPRVVPADHWEVVQWQDTRLWTVESGFESLLPSQPEVGGRGVRPKGAPTSRGEGDLR